MESDPASVPEAAAAPLIVNQAAEDVAVQLSVPVPLLLTVTIWLDGFAPPCTAENDIETGFRAIIGVVGVEVVTADVVGVSNWVKPGMAVDSFFIPRPLSVVLPWVDDPGAATAETGDELDDGEDDVAPANDRDVDGDVVAIDVVVAGAGAGAVVEVSGAESLL